MLRKAIRSGFAVCAAVIVGLVLQVPSSAAVETAGPEPGLATFEGRTIDLSEGWGEARSCLVYSSTRVECYRTRAQADAVLGYDPAKDPMVDASTYSANAAAAPACDTGWICLYADSYGGGRRLQFSDEYWHSLYTYGFDHATSSWRNIQDGQWLCNDQGVLGDGAGGAIYLDDCSYSNTMGVYNDWAVDVHG